MYSTYQKLNLFYVTIWEIMSVNTSPPHPLGRFVSKNQGQV